MEECGNGIHGDDEIQYGEWMIATRRSLPSNQFGNSWARPASQRGRAGNRGGGRNPGSGRGNPTEWGNPTGARKRSSQEAGLHEGDDLCDTAESPLKGTGPVDGEGQGDEATKRKLDLSAERMAAVAANSKDSTGSTSQIACRGDLRIDHIKGLSCIRYMTVHQRM